MNQLDGLLHELVAILSDGIDVDSSVEKFIYTSTGINPDLSFIEESIASESSEFESVLDLIFFPDGAARERVEKVIPESFNEIDEKNLIEKIIRLKPFCLLRFTQKGFTVSAQVPERFLERFVRRLNFCAEMPDQLRVLVRKHYPGFEYSVFKNIRAASIGGNTLALIMDFLQKATDIIPPDVEDLNIIMTVSGMFPKETEIASAINLAYIKWDASLKKHEDIEKALSSGCMEELMAKGMRVQAINRDDIEKKMAAAGRVMNILRFSVADVPLVF